MNAGRSPFPVVLDITRSVARAAIPAPTGIDRVERAYVDWALRGPALFIVRVGRLQYLLDAAAARLVLRGGGSMDLPGLLRPWRARALRRAEATVRRLALSSAPEIGGIAPFVARQLPGAVYLNVGHTNLTSGMMAALRGHGITTAAMVHDLIPLRYPEYTRPGQDEIFAARLSAAVEADLLVANSEATALALKDHAGQRITTAPLGISAPQAVGRPERPPRFVCVGTIEPRKNHAMLLDIWAEFPPDGPVLDIIGRRGWRNEAVFRRLDALETGTVIEHGALDQPGADAILSRATAIVFPSRAEGYGLPVGEALAMGLPVIASDLPALREVGGVVPLYLPPDDPAAWRAAILDMATADSPERARQLALMPTWNRPDWATHFGILERELETILVQSGTEH